jgi:hypothetical protein
VKPPKAKRAPNQERILYDDLLRKLVDLLSLYQGMIRITILRNIALLTYALLTLFHGARGGNGWLSQAALARCLPLQSSPKAKEQRLGRLLHNPRLTPEILIPLHVALVLGIQSLGTVPLILDQTTVRGIQTLLLAPSLRAASCRSPSLVLPTRKSKRVKIFWNTPSLWP